MAFEALKQFQADKAKAADAGKGRDRGAVYRTITPGTLGAKGGYDPVGRFRDSGGYSYARAMAVASRAIDPRQAKEECETDQFLRETLVRQGGFKTTFGMKGFLAVGGSRFLPTQIAEGESWDVMVKFQKDIREKMLATQAAETDLDHPAVKNWMQTKSLEMQLGMKAMGVTVDSAVGTLVPAPAQGEFIDLQRNFESFTRAGAREMPLPPQGRVSLPKQTGGTTAYWVGEAATITSSDVATSNLYLEAKKLGVISTLSDEIMRFSDPQVEGIVRYDQAMQSGLKADSAMFTGTGGTQIAGLLGGAYPIGTANAVWTQGTDKVLLLTASTTGTDGDTFQPQDAIRMSQVLPDPVQTMPKTYIFNTAHSMVLMSRRADAITAADQKGPFVFDLNRDPATGLPNGMYGNKLVTSYNVPSNRVKGSSGATLTLALCGAFSDWIIARSGVVEFDSNPYSNFAQVQTLLRTIQYIDAGPRHNASFSYIDSLLPTT
jgi:HK97 family phage major capsid protein